MSEFASGDARTSCNHNRGVKVHRNSGLNTYEQRRSRSKLEAKSAVLVVVIARKSSRRTHDVRCPTPQLKATSNGDVMMACE